MSNLKCGTAKLYGKIGGEIYEGSAIINRVVDEIYKQSKGYPWQGYVSVENLYGGGFHSYWYSGLCPIKLIKDFYGYKENNIILGWKLEQRWKWR